MGCYEVGNISRYSYEVALCWRRLPIDINDDYEYYGAMNSYITVHDAINEFETILGLKSSFEEDFLKSVKLIYEYINKKQFFAINQRRKFFVGKINYKFRLNSDYISSFYYESAMKNITFNFHQKKQIQSAFDNADKKNLFIVLKELSQNQEIVEHLLNHFYCVTEDQTIAHVVSECNQPKKLRKDLGDRDVANDILKSLFTSYTWSFLPEKEYHLFFNPDLHTKNYNESFWEQLRIFAPNLYNRDNALEIHLVDLNKLYKIYNYGVVENNIFSIIKSAFSRINNYGHLVLIFPTINENQTHNWEHVEKTIYYAEKFNEILIEKTYFRHEKIAEITKKYIPEINVKDANFSLVNEGFTYKDTYILTKDDERIEYIMLIFQKNQRDETIVPCPSCRSLVVQGNSYPSLGVRSWECNNPLCFDKSKYNRGKRYSFKGLLMQEAIDEDVNLIDKEYIKKWKRDVVKIGTIEEAVEVLIRCYSMSGDTVTCYNYSKIERNFIGRKIRKGNFNFNNDLSEESSLNNLSFNYRINIHNTRIIPNEGKSETIKDQTLVLGDSSSVLRTYPDSYFDGAITSPPYYNAKEYSQWSNIYCYLFDMRDVAIQVYRTLKDGSYFLYNIFNYFDNENSIVFSAMGQKRMILSSYIVSIFTSIGFKLTSNIVWDKGDIEGKRGFNAGNYSPFYQSPFNCWEHVLVFKKPGTNTSYSDKTITNLSSKIHKSKPVFKIINGENTYGHTAPFPISIPNLLLKNLSPKSCVLDPYGGSMTTARSALYFNCKSVCIEKNINYYKLGIRMIENFEGIKTENQAELF